MLTAIELRGDAVRVPVLVPLSRFTLLVGDHATGKTAVLDAVERELKSRGDAVTSLCLDRAALVDPTVHGDGASLGRRGEGLAAVIDRLLEVAPASFGRLHDDVRAVIPQLETFEVAGEGPTVSLSMRFRRADWCPAHAASEGALIALGTLAALHALPLSGTLLVDDLGRALHPRALGALVDAMRRELSRRRSLQIIATTHSPYLADHFEPESVVVLGRPDGVTVVARRLSEHPDRRLREALTTGEFLVTSGEGWFGG